MPEIKSINYYDFLMISPRADRAMIEWAVRLMLTRYDPKNSKTGDSESYEIVRDAYLTLVDAEKRAEHDADLARQAKSVVVAQAAISFSAPAIDYGSDGPLSPEALLRERERRNTILRMLYEQMAANPIDPGVNRTTLMRTLVITTAELEFTLWYLREKQWMVPSQKGSYHITVNGMELMEEKALAQAAALAPANHDLSALSAKVNGHARHNNGVDAKSELQNGHVPVPLEARH